MKKIYLLFIVLFSFLGVKNSFAQCEYTLELWDSWGDGWSGGTIEVFVNGTSIGVTTVTGTSNVVTISGLITGEILTFNYTAGSYAGENAWQLRDPNDVIIHTEGGSFGLGPTSNGATPNCGNGGSYTIACPSGCPHSLVGFDSYGDGWNGNTVDVLVNGVVVLNDYFLSGGSTASVNFYADNGDNITTIWNGGGSFGYETSYSILDGVGTTIGTGAQTSITTPIAAFCPGALDYCGGDLFTDNGGSAANYTNNANDTWTICPDNPGDVVSFDFTSFNVEDGFDGLLIYNGNSPSSPLISSGLAAGLDPVTCPAGAWTGTGSPGLVTSTDASGCLTFVFSSDGSGNFAGWEANVTCGTPNYRSNFISTNTGATDWCAGETRSITVTVENIGLLDWTDVGADDFSIGAKWNADPSYIVKVDALNLTAGSTQIYTFNITAPATTGFDNLTFDVIKEGCFNFADNSTACGNTAGPGNIEFLSSTITIKPSPTAVSAGSDVTICEGTSTTLNGSATTVIGEGVLQVEISGAGFLDEITWSLTNAASVIIGSGGNYGLGSTNIINIASSVGGPYTFFLETQGLFGDNVTSYVVRCNGSTIISGTLLGGLTTSLPVSNCTIVEPLSFTWSPTTGLSNPNIANPVATPSVSTNYIMNASAGGCSITDTVAVTVNGSNVTPINPVLADATSSYTCDVSGLDWHYFYNTDGELLMGINSNGENLGSVTIEITEGDQGPFGQGLPPGVCGATGVIGEFVLPRYWDITVANQPTVASDVIFYFLDSEVAALANTTAVQNQNYKDCWGQVTTEADLMMTVDHGGGSLQTYTIAPTAGPKAGQRQIAFQMTQFSGGKLHSNKGLYAGNPLPVEMIAFTAKAVNNQFIQLNWSTATEINNKGFEVQRSLDGLSFEKIGFITGNGNSNLINNYSFQDNNVAKGVYYYKLKQIDFDGQFEFSEIRNASILGTEKLSVSYFIPNPAENNSSLNFEVVKDTKVLIEIYDGIGRKVIDRNEFLTKGKNSISFNTTELASGIYSAKILVENEEFTRKLVINK